MNGLQLHFASGDGSRRRQMGEGGEGRGWPGGVNVEGLLSFYEDSSLVFVLVYLCTASFTSVPLFLHCTI